MRAHDLTVATMGHAQHGKSSLLGCIAVHFRGPEHLERIRAAVEEKIRELRAPELRYSLIFDLPKNDFAYRERALGEHSGSPTKTVSRLPGWVGCRIGSRRAMLVDEPGHPQFLKYMIGPSAGADVGILVLDAAAFVEDHDRARRALGPDCFFQTVDSRVGPIPLLLKKARDERHALASHPREAGAIRSESWVPHLCIHLLNYLALCEVFGIVQVVVAVHQLDKVDFARAMFEDACARFLEMSAFLRQEVRLRCVPTAVLAAVPEDHNVTSRSRRMLWYDGPTVAELLLEVAAHHESARPGEGPLRLQVERVAEAGRRARHAPPPRVFGRVDSGVLRAGDTVGFTPAGVSARVRSIRLRDESRFLSARPYWDDGEWDVAEVWAGAYVSVALVGKEFAAALPRTKWQSQLMHRPGESPAVSRWFRVRLQIVPPWWLEERLAGLTLLYGYERVSCQVPWVPGHQERWWETMTVPVTCERPVALDVYRRGGALGKIVIERDGFVVAGGTVVEVLEEEPRAHVGGDLAAQ